MSALFNLLTLPITGPLKGVLWVAQQVADEAEQRYYGPDALRAALAELHRAYEAGEIEQAEFVAAEEELLDRLELAWEQEQQQMTDGDDA